jgi:histidyl-tRNA synthetase
MHDVLPEEGFLWEKLRSNVRDIAEFYGFGFIETPIVEYAELFERGVGHTTELVEKEMYTFRTKGGDRVALRPEGTAGVVRAYIQHGMQTRPQPVKFWYWGPMFRHDAPQALRYREFHQAGFECLGEASPSLDAEVIQVTYKVLEEFGIPAMRIEINSIGCQTCRPAYQASLKAFYRARAGRLCPDCRRRLVENPLRLLDCKEEQCVALRSGAPEIVERLCEECRNHFKKLLEMLDMLGYPYLLNSYLVRGFDYYTRTVFEIFPELEPSRSTEGAPVLAIAAGGRYDKLVEFFGGPPTPAVGSAIGVERAIAAVRQMAPEAAQESPERPSAFVVQLGDLARVKALKLIEEFRRAGIGLASSLGRDSIKSQLKVADRLGVPFALIIGHKEAIDDNVILRDMASGSQETIPTPKIIDAVRSRLKKQKGRR